MNFFNDAFAWEVHRRLSGTKDTRAGDSLATYDIMSANLNYLVSEIVNSHVLGSVATTVSASGHHQIPVDDTRTLVFAMRLVPGMVQASWSYSVFVRETPSGITHSSLVTRAYDEIVQWAAEAIAGILYPTADHLPTSVPVLPKKAEQSELSRRQRVIDLGQPDVSPLSKERRSDSDR